MLRKRKCEGLDNHRWGVILYGVLGPEKATWVDNFRTEIWG